jgi:hypothetical protein
MLVEERRDGAREDDGARGAGVPTQHTWAASVGGAGNQRHEVRAKFHRRSNVKHSILQPRVSGHGRPSRCSSGSSAVVFFMTWACLVGEKFWVSSYTIFRCYLTKFIQLWTN